MRIPAGVEQHEQRLDAMAGRDADELRQSGLETARILRVQLVVQEDPHGIESVQTSPTEFGVDAARVIGAWLEHLQLVDRSGGDEVGADRPALGLVPTVSSIR
jgi:hypothetical protein